MDEADRLARGVRPLFLFVHSSGRSLSSPSCASQWGFLFGEDTVDERRPLCIDVFAIFSGPMISRIFFFYTHLRIAHAPSRGGERLACSGLHTFRSKTFPLPFCFPGVTANPRRPHRTPPEFFFLAPATYSRGSAWAVSNRSLEPTSWALWDLLSNVRWPSSQA